MPVHQVPLFVELGHSSFLYCFWKQAELISNFCSDVVTNGNSIKPDASGEHDLSVEVGIFVVPLRD